MGATRWRDVVGAVLVRPWLWPTALVVAGRLVPRQWWRHRPWLPLPDPAYLEFRMTTAFGPDAGPPPVDETVSFLKWCRAWPRLQE